jgi:predicted component of type VI protein secretion system
MPSDFTIDDQGQLIHFKPVGLRADELRAWVNENVGDPMWWCGSLVVDHHHFHLMLNHLNDAGFFPA